MAADALPFSGLRIVELEADLLSGRLTGMLFADQGAEVIILNSDKGEKAKLTDGSDEAERRANDMLNRNKRLTCVLCKYGITKSDGII